MRIFFSALALLRPPPFPSFFPVQASPRTASRIPCLRYPKLEKKRRERRGQLRRACREIPDSILPAPSILPAFEGSVPLTRSTEERGSRRERIPGNWIFMYHACSCMNIRAGFHIRTRAIFQFTPSQLLRRSGRIRFLSRTPRVAGRMRTADDKKGGHASFNLLRNCFPRDHLPRSVAMGTTAAERKRGRGRGATIENQKARGTYINRCICIYFRL